MWPHGGGGGWGEGWLPQVFNSILTQGTGDWGKNYFDPKWGILGRKTILLQMCGILGKILSVWNVWGVFGGSGGQNKPQEVYMR